MTAHAPETPLDERLETLEAQFAQTTDAVWARLFEVEWRLDRVDAGDARDARGRLNPRSPDARSREAHPDETAPHLAAEPAGEAIGAPQGVERPTGRDGVEREPRPPSWLSGATPLGDLVGGRVLAWLGGLATLLGIVLLLALAVSHGWLGEQARALLAGAASAALLAAGTWLHGHRGRTEAATVMAGTVSAGMFATLIVAGAVYALIPPLVVVLASVFVGGLGTPVRISASPGWRGGAAVGQAGIVGAASVTVWPSASSWRTRWRVLRCLSMRPVATTLAIRWAGQRLGWLGLIGALVSLVLIGAPADGASMAVLGVAAVCAMWVVVRQRWGWLALATVLICAPQVALWTLRGQTGLADAVAIGVFAAVGLAGAVATQARSAVAGCSRCAFAVLMTSACVAAIVGRAALDTAAATTAGEVCLLAPACLYAATAATARRRARVAPALRRLLIALAVTLADVAFALTAHGVILALGWGATAVGFAYLARRVDPRSRAGGLLDLGIGAHLGLVLIRALIEAPPSVLGGGDAGLLPILTVAILAASCAACGRLAGARRGPQRMALDVARLCAVAYLSAAALAVAWAVEALALMELRARTGDEVARLGGLAFLAGASAYATAVTAPPVALVSGAAHLGSAAVALGVVALAGVRAARTLPATAPGRRGLLIGAAASALYLASVAIITVFQPTDALGAGTVLDLSVRQQGQVVLSALLSLVGLGTLLVGLRRNVAALRSAGLAMLLLTVAKVFLYDLSTLTAGYRVISVAMLALLLLAGAFAYQRLPPKSTASSALSGAERTVLDRRSS